MSWLTQSVTGRISQIGGQLKDILTESTEDVVDPSTELKVVNDKLKDNEKHVELLKMELAKWQEEANELNLKCQTYENQLEQKQFEHRNQIMSKDFQIDELKKQLNTVQSSKSELIDSGAHSGYQKSAFMEEFEDIMPTSEYSDYINLQKEIKRLSEDNVHLLSENKQLINKLKKYEKKSEAEDDAFGIESSFSIKQLEYETQIENLKQEIYSLKARLQTDKDKHQEEIIGIQESYKEKLNSQLNDNQMEMELLRGRIAELENKLIESETVAVNKISSNKSDDGWCLNGDEINLETVEKKADTSENEKKLQALLNEKDEEIANLENQVELFSNELEQANGLILRLKNLKQNSPDVSPKPNNDELNRKAHEIKELKQEINDLVSKNDTLTKQLDELNETVKNERAKHDSDIEEKEKHIDSLNLDLKQLQQSIQQEKMLQLQDNKQEKHEIVHLKTENAELKVKLDEKLGEIKLLGDQINELNHNINSLKSTDSSLFAELQNKTEQFVAQIDDANKEIALLKSDKEKLNEQRKQLEFLCEEKVRENSQLKNDIQKHIQHISAQSKAIEKLQADLKELESSSSTKVKSEEEGENKPDQSEELNLMREQYNQIYTYLEQKNQESLSYYNEIQRLNQVVSDLNRELLNTKTVNENLNEQYDHLVKEFQLEQKMVDDINQQTFELNKTLISTSNVVAEAVALQNQKQEAEISDESLLVTKEKIKQEIEEDIVKREKEKLVQLEENNRQVIEQMEYQIKALMGEREQIVQASKQYNEEMSRKLNETVNHYESIIRSQNENFKNNLLNEEQQQQRLSKELERLREHLVEMSDSYNREAVEAEEREKQLRLALSKAEEKLQQQGANLETSSKEVELRLEQLNQSYQEIKNDRDKLKDRLKQSEENLNHQIKVTKNLELVLERLQNDKDSQNSFEITKYQQTIKEHALTIHNLQKEAENYQNEIKNMKEALEAASLIEADLDKKEEHIKHLQSQIGTKDALIESLDKRVNETQKLNDSYIEKEIIKNLIIGYIKVSHTQEKKQVLKLISMMLNFSPNELEQAENTTESKWFSGLLKSSTPSKNPLNKPGTSADALNKSFTELLIQYVDRESKPKPNLAFDLNDSSVSHKKTDNPLLMSEPSPLASSSASAIKFFNTNLVSNTTNPNAADLNLVNRNLVSNTGQQQQQQQQQQNVISGLSSPSVANSFLEQILKND